MTATFLDRNKKKSLLAALLLFMRQRKLLVLLVLLVLLASTVFLGPSTWGLPGGQRFVAGIAWIAGKMGYDTSKWGLRTVDRRSYGDLLAVFRAAKNEAGGGLTWGALFGRGAPGASPNSLDFVKGSKADLARGTAAAGAGAQSVAGIVDPADPKSRGGDAVAISEADLGGEREGFVREAFAGGFLNGLLGGNGDGALSGGAFASKGFFGGVAGAASSPNGLAAAGLAAVPSASSPSSTRGGAATGSLSAMTSRSIAVKATKALANASSLGGKLAYTQLAEGVSRDQLGTTYCQPPNCPAEYATTNSGAIYDGNTIGQGMLTSSDPGAVTSGLINATVDVPPDDAGGAAGDAQNMATCAGLVQQCATSKTAPMNQEGVDETQLQTWYQQMGTACGNPCNCGPCNALNAQINGLCSGDLATQIALANAPCAPLPDYCGSLGFTAPASTMQGTGQDLCQKNPGKCSCGFLCGVMCLL
jgi:hypothetical protein